jgi:hypothetical protein
MAIQISVPPTIASDEREWRRLWTGFLELYEAKVK